MFGNEEYTAGIDDLIARAENAESVTDFYRSFELFVPYQEWYYNNRFGLKFSIAGTTTKAAVVNMSNLSEPLWLAWGVEHYWTCAATWNCYVFQNDSSDVYSTTNNRNSLIKLDTTEGTSDYKTTKFQTNGPCFGTEAEGLRFSTLVRNYFNNRTSENLNAIKEFVEEHSSMPGHVASEWEKKYGLPSTAEGYGVGGYGSHDNSSDTIGIPQKPQYGISSPGFLNVYKVSSSGLQRLGTALFPQPIRVTTDVMDAVNELVANMWNSKLLDYVLDCHIIPVSPADGGSANVTAGGKVLVDPETQQVYSALRVSEDYTDIDCGTISIPEYYANFLDFNCKAKLFLPFLGFQEIKPEYWNGGTLSIKYRFNVYDGSFMCWVLSSSGKSNLQSTVVLQMSGNACIHIPLNSQSYANVLSGIITTGAGLVGAAAGGAAGAKLGAAAVSGAVQIANLKPTHSQSNHYNASAAIMSVRKPYLLIEYPVAQFSTGYTDELGLPLNVYKSLGSVTGLTICDNPILNIAATDKELKELESLLKSGVIL